MESILIADDNSDLRDALTLALRAEGYRVRAARDAYEARRLFVASRPDLLLSDIRMPGDGLRLLHEVHDLSPATPVILMTAVEEPGDRHEAIAGGAADFLLKPVAGARLRAALRRALARHASDAPE